MYLKKILKAIRWRIALPFTILFWWIRGKKKLTPHYIKQRMLKKYKNKGSAKVLVETGTFMGEMVNAMKNEFSFIHSIELNPEFAKNAKNRFANQKHIKIWQGDSGAIIKDVLNELTENTLFWLDGHCCIHAGNITSKADFDSPIEAEIKHIEVAMKQKSLKPVILIDDARLFVGRDGYPEIDKFCNYLKESFQNSKVFVENDIIVVLN